MLPELKSEFPVTEESCKEQTGRTITEWQAVVEEQGGLKLGRRAIMLVLYEHKVPIWWTAALNVEFEARAGIKEKDGRAKGFYICPTKTIAAPLEQVYAAFASPAALNGWLGSNHVGEVADGSTTTNDDGNRLTWKRVRPNKDLRFLFEHPGFDGPSIVDITFTDKGKGKTMLIAAQDRLQSAAESDAMRKAWAAAFDRLVGVLAETK